MAIDTSIERADQDLADALYDLEAAAGSYALAGDKKTCLALGEMVDTMRAWLAERP